MANRFYFAPIDPGYGAFGSAIAAGMGQAMSAVAAGKEREREEERYRQRTELEQRRHDEQLARERAAIEAQNIQAGRVTVEPTGTIASGPMGMPIFVPRSPVATATGATGSFPQPAPAPTIPEATGAIGLTAGVAGLTGPAPAGVASGGAAGATEVAGSPVPPAPSPISSARQFLGIPEGATFDPRIGRYTQFDPSRSEAAQTEAYSWRTQQERTERERRDTANFIAKVMADGKIDLAEIPEIRARNMKPEDFDPAAFDPDKLLERHMKQFEKERNIIHQHEMAEIREREKNDAATRQRELTANQQQFKGLREISGRVRRAFQQGLTAAQIERELAGLAEELEIGEGEVAGIVAKTFDDLTKLRYTDAANAADLALQGRNLFAGTAEYAAELPKEIRNQMRLARERDLELSRAYAPPTTGRIEGVSIRGGGSPIETARTPVAAPPEVVSQSAPATVGNPNLPPGTVGSAQLDSMDRAFMAQQRQLNPNLPPNELWRRLEENRKQRSGEMR